MKSTDQVEEIETEKKPARKPDSNFVKAGKRTVGEYELAPFSPSREVAAQTMGLHYAYVDDAGKERYVRTSLYPGAIRDVAIVMWLCCKATEDEIDGAGIEPKSAVKKAIDWAHSEGILNVKNDFFWKAYTAFWQMMDEIAKAGFEPQKKTLSESTAKKK